MSRRRAVVAAAPAAVLAAALAGVVAAVIAAVRRHWIAASLIAAGFVLRVLAQVAYQPALVYVDSLKYLYTIYAGSDPLGYEAPLKAILLVGNLAVVAAVQHLLGLAIAVTIYALLLRRGVPRWLSALAIAPVLLDAYQIQIEQNIMPDVWFEALVVAGAAILLARPAADLRLRAILTAGLLLGASATFRQVGEILLLPGLVFLVALGGGAERVFNRCVVFTASFAVPVLGYMIGSAALTGHFALATATPSLSTYGRLVTAADCQALQIPTYERALCPTKRQLAYGIDWLDHDVHSPLKAYVAPRGMNRYAVISSFDHQVFLQQPGRILVAVARDGLKLFAVGPRTSAQGGTPIARWQFQPRYPSYPPWVNLRPDGRLVFGLPPAHGTAVHGAGAHGTGAWRQIDGGHATAVAPLAAFLRAYQLDGGYTPGPLMALFALAGITGPFLLLVRRKSETNSAPGAQPTRAQPTRAQPTRAQPTRGQPTRGQPTRGQPTRAQPTRALAQACLLFIGCGAAILAMSDVFEFTWRYQLPALVTLPPAGALGAAAWLTLRARGQRGDDGTGQPSEDGTGQPSTQPSQVRAEAV